MVDKQPNNIYSVICLVYKHNETVEMWIKTKSFKIESTDI